MTGPITHPAGARVRLRYGRGRSWLLPYHDCEAVVVQPPWGTAKRNHLVRVTAGEFVGRLLNVPAGNLKAVVEPRGAML